MDYQVLISHHEQYLHVEVRGEANYKNALAMWKEVVQACESHQCYRILGEQNMLHTVSTSDAYDHPKLFREAGVTRKHRIAWVDHNPRTRTTTEFIHDVLTNRQVGGQGRVFSNLDKARQWLLQH